MTKKDYKFFAEMIAKLELEEEKNKEKISIEKVESELVEILEKDNPNFNWSKWRKFITEFKERK